MASKIKVDNIHKISDDSVIIKKCGSTTTVGSGCGQTIVVDGATVTLGRCGGSVALASGASQTGFGRTGTVDWQTGSIKTSTFTAVNGEGYFVDTSSGAVTVNLPAGSAGAIVAFADYTRTFGSNNLTISPNGSEKVGGVATDAILNVDGQAATLVYVDGTEGWINVQNAEDTETGVPPFIVATGGTISTSGDYKIHTFTGPGTFQITNAGIAPNNVVDYLVVAGGGAGTGVAGSGAGAGGFRLSNDTCMSAPQTSPLANSSGITSSVASFPITVGAGGSAPNPAAAQGPAGSSSTFSTITSAGGGGSVAAGNAGQDGGSGSGGGGENPGSVSAAGSGNTPPVSPPQGNNGGTGGQAPSQRGGGGGGGAGAAGQNGGAPGGDGGAGSFVEQQVLLGVMEHQVQ